MPFFAFYPDKPVTIILLKRSDYSISRIENIPSFFVYHFVNAYEEDNKINLDMVLHQKLNLNPALNENNVPPALYQGVIDLKNLSYQHKCLSADLIVEFPNYNLDYCGQRYRFAYLLAKKPNTSGGFNLLIKYNLVNNKFIYTDFGTDAEIGEATFIASNNCQNEDDGYLVLFVYCKSSDCSDFIVLSAKDMQEIARVKLPRRVPLGLHGSWIATK
jgi:carotenoid cleavage dioxygenase